jgi:hypothetical protein
MVVPRVFLTALLVAACAAAVLAPSAVTKKPPTTTPTGTFYVEPMSSISVTGMTLKSEDQVAVFALVGDLVSPLGQFNLGSNSGVDPGVEVALADWSYANTDSLYAVPVRLVLADLSAVVDPVTNQLGGFYLSDGTFKTLEGGSPLLPVSHVTVGAGDKGEILLSMNDGSQNPTTKWEPDLGAGNFNASVRLTAPKAPAATITSITAHSDGPVDVAGVTKCGYHVTFEYTVNKAKPLVGALAVTVFSYGDGIGPGVQETLTASPFTGSAFHNAPNLPSGDYYFSAIIENAQLDTLAVRSAMVHFDSTKYDTFGCPDKGPLASTSLAG